MQPIPADKAEPLMVTSTIGTVKPTKPLGHALGVDDDPSKSGRGFPTCSAPEALLSVPDSCGRQPVGYSAAALVTLVVVSTREIK